MVRDNVLKTSRGHHFLGWVALLALIPMLAIVGCNSGKRGVTDPTVTPPPECDGGVVGTPFVLSVSTNEGCAGEIILIDGLNFSTTDLLKNSVFFSANNGGFVVQGRVISVVDNGPHPIFACPNTILEVYVPAGVRSGTVSVHVLDEFDITHDAGGAPWTACPQIVGFSVGGNRNGYGTVEITGSLGDDLEIDLYGYNMQGVTTGSLLDDDSTTFLNIPTSGVSAADLPTDMQQARMVVDSSTSLAIYCPTSYVAAEVASTFTGSNLASNKVLVPIRTEFIGGDFDPMPATIVAMDVPAGILRGNISVDFALLENPATLLWDVTVEYLVPGSPVWAQATLVDPVAVQTLLSGGENTSPTNPAFLTKSATYSFIWDSSADITGNSVETTRLRLSLTNVSPVVSDCETTFDSDALFESRTMTIRNPVDGAGDPTELTGSVQLSFNDNFHQDPGFQSSANWNVQESGELQSLNTSDSPWGTGFEDIVLVAGTNYVINTANGSVNDLDNSILLNPNNPGTPVGEVWARTLIVQAGANIQVVGPNPVIFRVAGTGTVDDIVCTWEGTLNLDGGVGATGVNGGDFPSQGGTAIAGGGVGGNSGWINFNTPMTEVTEETSPQRGGNFGGEPGQNVTWAREGAASQPGAAPGSGGGHLTRGGDAVWDFTPAQLRTFPGVGGPARGDERNLNLLGGSGGGGGGTLVHRLSPTADLISRNGGAGGGGGGVFAIYANGSIQFTGNVSVNGGAGGNSASVTSGAGGGGSGGTILLSSTGNVIINEDAELNAVGGRGFVRTPNRNEGGDGSDGRIRIEAAGVVAFPSIGVFDLVEANGTAGGDVGLPGISAGVAPQAIYSGNGLDGPLVLAGAGNIFTVNTDTGQILDAANIVIVERAQDPIAFHLSTLTIEENVTLRGVGSLPLVILVAGECIIDGIVDVSGSDGLISNVAATPPLPGAGGAAGPGGGTGGTGGFANSPTNFANGASGGMPSLLLNAGLVDDGSPLIAPLPIPGPIPFSLAIPATGGESQTDSTINAQGGSGGGGGYFAAGGNAGAGGIATVPGIGGSAYGSAFFQDPTVAAGQTALLAIGGAGGGGGAGNANAFATETFDQAPGSGGGGGGGMLQLSVQGNLTISSTAQLLAKGGDAFAAPALAGNGGAGAGGGILLQCESFCQFAGAADVRGGTANIIDGSAPYIPNTSLSGAGDGARGIFRIETPLGFAPAGASNLNPTPSIGDAWMALSSRSEVRTISMSLDIDGAISEGYSFGNPILNGSLSLAELLLPVDGHAVVLYESAREGSTPGVPDSFAGLVDDPSLLDPLASYVRMTFVLFTSRATSIPVVIDSFELPFELPTPD